METLLVALELLTNVYSDNKDDFKVKCVQEDIISQKEDGDFEDEDEEMKFNEDEDEEGVVELDSEEEAAEAILYQENGILEEDVASDDSGNNSEESEEENAFEMIQNDAIYEDKKTVDSDNPQTIDTLLMQLINIADIKIESQQASSAKNIVSLLYSIKTCTFGALSNMCLKSKKSWIRTHYSQLWSWVLQHATQDSQESIQFDDKGNLDSAFKSDLVESNIGLMLVLIERAAFVDSGMIVYLF